MRRNPGRVAVRYACCAVLCAVGLAVLAGVGSAVPASVAAPTTFNVGGTATGVALSPDGKTLYVANVTDSTVRFFDTSSGNQTASVSVTGTFGGHLVHVANHYVLVGGADAGGSPVGMTLSHDGKKLYVGDNGKGLSGVAIVVVDTATAQVTDAFSLSFPAQGMTLSPDGALMYVATGRCNLVILDLVHGSATSPYVEPITGGPNCTMYSVVATPDAKTLNMIDEGGARLVTFDATASPPNAIASTALDPDPFYVAASPDASKLFVIHDNGTVDVVSPGGTILASIPGGAISAFPLTLSPDGRVGYRLNRSTGSIEVLDLVNYKQVATMKVANSVYAAVVNPQGTRLYVSTNSDHSVVVVEVSTKSSTGSSSGGGAAAPPAAAGSTSAAAPSPTTSPSPTASALAVATSSSTGLNPLVLLVVGGLVLLLAAVAVLIFVVLRRPPTPPA